MTILQKFFIFLIIMFMVFAALALVETMSWASVEEANRYSTSVAWLEMCASSEADLIANTYSAKTYVPL